MSDHSRVLGALLYPGFEMLDLFGPLEMFSIIGEDRLQIVTIGEQAGPVPAALGMAGPVGPQVVAQYDFDSAPTLDLLLVPGGSGSRRELDNPAMLDFLVRRAREAALVASVCTGSALLAKAGLLDGRRATSNKQVFALATQQSDRVDWISRARWVEDDPFFTSSGVSAGMDMALAIIEKLWGAAAAAEVESATEYRRERDPDNDPFADELNQLARALGML
jgi:putative intracellular protease/amidase